MSRALSGPRSRLMDLGFVSVIGLGVGLLAYVVDEATIRSLSGIGVFGGTSYRAYLLTGLVFGVLVGVLGGLFGRPTGRGSVLPLGGTVWALLYGLALVDRVAAVIHYRLDLPGFWSRFELVVAVALSGAALYGLWWTFEKVSTSRAAAGWLTGGLVAVVVALNRHVLGSFFSPRAVLVNFLLGAGFLAVAVLGRRSGELLPAALGPALPVLLCLLPTLRPVDRPMEDPQISPAPAEATNLLLVVADTLRQDVFRSVLDETPEGLAFKKAMGGAVYFDQGVAAAPWTGPSMASVLTGLYPVDHGMVGHDTKVWGYRRLAPGLRTLAMELTERGYWTEALVANIMLRSNTEIHRGFQRYRIASGESERLPVPAGLARLGLSRREYYARADAVRRVFEGRLDYLETLDRPFFFWLHFMDPHQPLHAHGELRDEPGAADGDELDRLYRQETRFVLAEVARALETLDGSPLGRRTHVVFLSDHGEMMPSDRPWDDALRVRHGHGQDLYEPLLHVPLVVRPAGASAEPLAQPWNGSLVGHVDVMPTLLDLLGIEARRPHPKAVGRSVAETILGAAEPDSSERFFAWSGTYHQGRRLLSLRGVDYKLILDTDEGRPRFFDLRADGDERIDLSTSEIRELELFITEMDRLRTAHPPLPTLSDEVVLDDEARKRLEALGYTGH